MASPHLVGERFIGGADTRITATTDSSLTFGLYRGRDRSRWIEGSPSCSEVILTGLYDDVDLTLRVTRGCVEKIFRIGSGAHPSDIRIEVSGGQELHINESGELEIDTPLGTIVSSRPIAYQEVDGGRVDVRVSYTVTESIYSFEADAYDTDRELVIDPMLASTFVGQTGADGCFSILTAPDGSVYVAGSTESVTFPWHAGDIDVFVSKLSADLGIVESTIIFGGNAEDGGYWLKAAIGGNGKLFLCGTSRSTDFPVTPGAYDTNYGGHSGEYAGDVFVARVDADLAGLEAATYLGGSMDDAGQSIVIDGGGDVIVGGYTYSNDFPATYGCYKYYKDMDFIAFISKLNANLKILEASTFFDGNGAILALGENDRIFAFGTTTDIHLPSTAGAYDRTFNGGACDTYIARFSNDLVTLEAATYLGGSDRDYGYSIGLDDSGCVFVVTAVSSPDFPTSIDAYDRTFNGGPVDHADIAISKLDCALTTLHASTYLGGFGQDDGFVGLGPGGEVYVCGWTSSTNFPTTAGAYDLSFEGGQEAFVCRFDRDLGSLTASTLLGSAGDDRAWETAFDAAGNVYVCGYTGSPGFPTTPGAPFEEYIGGDSDGFVCMLDPFLADSTQIAVRLVAFTAVIESGCVRITWRISEMTETADFMITASGHDAEWTVPVRSVSPREFEALDCSEHASGPADIIYRLYERTAGNEWRLLQEELVASSAQYGGTRLNGVYPNPFNPGTTVVFSMARAGTARLEIFDPSGRLIRRLADRSFEAGEQRLVWDGLDNAGRRVPSGVYHVLLSSDKTSVSRKIVLLR